MKITSNPTFIQRNLDATKSQSIKKNNSLEKRPIVENINQNPVKVTLSKIDTLTEITTLQKDYNRSFQMFGALTQLTEAIQSFKQKPNAFEENIQRVLENIKKDFPELSESLQKVALGTDQLLTESEILTEKVSQKVKQQQKSIAYYVIAEQNKDSIQTKTKDKTFNIPQDISVQQAPEIHSPHLNQVVKLLN